jgi:hypothetical protein
MAEIMVGKNVGKVRSEEFCDHLSKIKTGVKREPFTNEHKLNMHKAKSPRTAEHTANWMKAMVGKTNAGKTLVKETCPHCGKAGGVPAMKSWHFDNCKNKC